MRVGLLGYGLAGESFHAPLIAATPGLELATVITGSDERGARAAEQHPGVVVSADSDVVWDCDVVVVATPNRFHTSYAHEAITRGVPVVVDKPLAVSVADADALLADAALHDAKLTVFQNRRWDGDFLTARALVAGGQLGRITRLTTRFERFRPTPKGGWREAADPRDGAGQLLDLGSHLVDQAIQLLGPVESVYAEIATMRAGETADDDVFLALRHTGGATTHVALGAMAPVPRARLELTGTTGGFASQDLDVQEAQLRAGLGPGAPSFGLNPPGTLYGESGSSPHPVERGSWASFYAAVPAWLAGDAPAPVDPADARGVLQVLEAARRSAESSHIEVIDAP